MNLTLSKTRIIVLLLGLSLGLDSGIFFLPDMGAVFAGCEGVVSDEEFTDYADDFGGRYGFYDGVDGPYLDNGDGTVTDLGTELMWQQSNNGNPYQWENACAYCDTLALAGYSDWELPDIYQLASLLDNNYDENININYFIGTHSAMYRSGSTYADNTNDAWSVDFYDGPVYYDSKAYGAYVRCVRSGPSEQFDPLAFSINANEATGDAPFETFLSCVVDSGTPPYTYSWDFGDGTAGSTEQNPEHVYENPGTYTATVNVQDDAGKTASRSMTIQVNNPSSPNEIKILNVSPMDNVLPGETVEFSIEVEYSLGSVPDGVVGIGFNTTKVDSYNMLDNQIVSRGTGTIVFDVSVEPVDWGETGEFSVYVNISEYPHPESWTPLESDIMEIPLTTEYLTVSLTATPVTGSFPLLTSFFCTIDSGTPPYTYSWDFGDGTTNENFQKDVTHEYLTAGVYTATCTVMDGNARIQNSSIVITVTEAVPMLCTLNGSVVDDVTGSGIPGAGLSFTSTGFSREYQTGNDGAFHITDVPAGIYQVQVSADRYQSESLGSIPMTLGLVQTLTVSLEQNRPEITKPSEATVEIINNKVAALTVYADITDPDGIEDITSVTLNLSDIGSGLGTQAMLFEDADGRFEAVVTIPGETAARLYSVPVTAVDKAGFTDVKTIEIKVIRQSVVTIKPDQTATQKIDNPIDNQSLEIYIQIGETTRNRTGGGIRAAVEDCYVEVRVYQPDGELYGSPYQVYGYKDIVIDSAMKGQWTYETINYCAESIDVEIETRGANTGILTGTVKDTDTRKGVENAVVQWSLGGESVTNYQGYFSIVAVAGTCALVTSADDYKTRLRADVSLSSGKTTTLAIELVPDAFEPLPVPESQLTEMILKPADKADYLNQPLAAVVEDGNLTISTCFAPYQEAVNIYLGITLDHPDLSSYFLLFNSDDQLDFLTDTLFPWREMTSDWSEVELLSLPVTALPKANYTFHLLLTDDPDTLSRYDLRFFTINID